MMKKIIKILWISFYVLSMICPVIIVFMGVSVPAIFIDITRWCFIIGLLLHSFYKWHYYEKDQLSKRQKVVYLFAYLVAILVLAFLFVH